MIQKFEKWLSDKQRDNWGIPWHFSGCIILVILLFPVFYFKVFILRGFLGATIPTFFVVNLLGYLNEIINRDNDKIEFWEDVTANNIGIVTGLIMWYYILLFI